MSFPSPMSNFWPICCASRKKNPEADEEAAIRNAIKHVVPNTMPGTPGWHKQNLQDLLAMTEHNGMPHLFWTVTADEVSELKWQPIKDMEEILKRFNDSYTFKVSRNQGFGKGST